MYRALVSFCHTSIFRSVAAVLVGLLLASPAAMAAAATHNVLVLYANGRLLPANIAGDRGLVEGFEARPDLPVTLATEFLDQTRFSGADYERTFVTYLREKYAALPPDVIIAGATEALDFMLRHRAELFPRVPIVHMSVTSAYLQSVAPLPDDVFGTPLTYDIVGTIEQARRWHPTASRLAVVTGTSPWDREWEATLRARAAYLRSELTVDFIAGLTADELQQRLRNLPDGTIVFTPGFFRDGAGREFTPREAGRLVAASSTAPVYTVFSPFLGTGVVGGRMANYEEMGRIGARAAIDLIDGTAPAAMPLPAATPTPLQVDWRQLRRWGISSQAVPAGAIVHFREPTLWEAHRNQVLLGIAVMLLQAGLIVALLFERRRRRRTVAALARSEQHMRLAARAAGLSTWVLEEDTAEPPAANAARTESTLQWVRCWISARTWRESHRRIAPAWMPRCVTPWTATTNSRSSIELRHPMARGGGTPPAVGQTRGRRRACSASRSTSPSASSPRSRLSRTVLRCTT